MKWIRWLRCEIGKHSFGTRVIQEVVEVFLMGQPRPFSLFSFFSSTHITEETVGSSRILTRILRVEGKHADHLNTTTAQVGEVLENRPVDKLASLKIEQFENWTV